LTRPDPALTRDPVIGLNAPDWWYVSIGILPLLLLMISTLVQTVLCDGLNDAAQQLVVVDNVEKMEGEEISVEHDTSD